MGPTCIKRCGVLPDCECVGYQSSFFLSQSQLRCVCITLQAYLHYVVIMCVHVCVSASERSTIFYNSLSIAIDIGLYLQNGNTKGNIHLHSYKDHHATLTHTLDKA